MATLTLRSVAVALAPPHRRAGVPVPVVVILAREEEPAAGSPDAPIHWMLTTTLPDPSLDGAIRAVRWYALRWLIERYHYVLKQGCRVEALQLETVPRLERALAIYAVVAWQVLWLTYLGRTTPEAPATGVLDPRAWQTLWAAVMPGAPRPDRPPTLAETVRLIARLGGFLARRGDGDPGVTTIWRGWMRLHDLLLGAAIATALPSDRDVGNA